MRLAKYLAHAGVASRRKSEQIIAAGRVRVDGRVVTDPAFGVEGGEEIRVDGHQVEPEGREVWMVNKPLEVISTADEPGKRVAVVDLVDSTARLYPVGRLDADSTGLILLSNDGELANRLTHPRYEVEKTYRVRLKKPVRDEAIEQLRQGVRLEDGVTSPATVRKLGERELDVTIHEGRNRQVRRMAEAVGNEVVGLQRISLGPLKLGRLPVGKCRLLDETEVERLWKDAGNE
ncbi:MAG: rRNA pseudouridine synthase [Solirubrobacterales bacterium]|nr:rRNA pseudouridine synthase [Solirubrobacterales bacterium]OJU95236.1 MAG: pseudouridine synthase [Solirubrobacterales bacterium 67-14]